MSRLALHAVQFYVLEIRVGSPKFDKFTDEFLRQDLAWGLVRSAGELLPPLGFWTVHTALENAYKSIYQ